MVERVRGKSKIARRSSSIQVDVRTTYVGTYERNTGGRWRPPQGIELKKRFTFSKGLIDNRHE